MDPEDGISRTAQGFFGFWGFRVLGFRVWGLRVLGFSGFRVWGLRVLGF